MWHRELSEGVGLGSVWHRELSEGVGLGSVWHRELSEGVGLGSVWHRELSEGVGLVWELLYLAVALDGTQGQSNCLVHVCILPVPRWMRKMPIHNNCLCISKKKSA